MPEVAGTKKADFVELERFLFEYIEPAFVEEAENILEALASVFSPEVSEVKMAGVEVVTGDTKVVQKGSADKIFINTAGIGVIESHLHISVTRAQAGNVDAIHCMRDPARIGVATTLNEIALSSEVCIPVREEVKGVYDRTRP